MMKHFFDGQFHYGMTSIRVLEVPYSNEHLGKQIMRRLCEDLYYLSDGDGRLSAELLRLAGTSDGGSILHLLVLRSRDRDESLCRSLHGAAERCMKKLLQTNGYRFVEVPFEQFSVWFSELNRSAEYALVKDEIRECEKRSVAVHCSLPLLAGEMDLPALYAALDGSGAGLSMEIIPRAASDSERAFALQMFADCSRAADGSLLPLPGLRDGLAGFSRERWSDYVRNTGSPMATVNIVISGAHESAAILTARLKSCLRDAHTEGAVPLRTLNLAGSRPHRIYDLPWATGEITRQLCGAAGYQTCRRDGRIALAQLISAAEAGTLMALPDGDGTFYAGVGKNAFSLLKKDLSLPEEITSGGADGILLGTMNGTRFHLPAADLLLHAGVFGKSGSGKTTLLLRMIRQLTAQGVPVLVLEPVKREYRSLIRENTAQVYTVDSNVSPFIINPFLPPPSVTLEQYRPHLLQAFQAAYSMPDPLPSLFGSAITEAYARYGWKDSSQASDPDVTVFGLWEFVQVFQDLIRRSNYSAEVRGNVSSGGTFRLLSLLDRSRKTFENIRSVDVQELLSGQVVLELGRLEGDQKCLVAALTLISVLAYLRTVRSSGTELRNVIVLDEAHVLMDSGSGSTEETKAADETMQRLLVNFVAEMRALEVGIIVADQAPTRVGVDLLDNMDTRILFRLSGTEAEAAAKAVGLDPDEKLALTQLARGEVLVSNHRLPSAAGVCTVNASFGGPVNDEELHEYILGRPGEAAGGNRPFQACACCPHCADGCDQRIREESAMRSIQLAATMPPTKNADALIKCLLQVPDILREQYPEFEDFDRLAACTTLQLYRRVCLERRQTLNENALSKLIGLACADT